MPSSSCPSTHFCWDQDTAFLANLVLVKGPPAAASCQGAGDGVLRGLAMTLDGGACVCDGGCAHLSGGLNQWPEEGEASP